jgi:hypothetical protein
LIDKIFRFSLDNIEPPNEQLEEEWQNQISENLSRLLQGLDESTVEKSNVCPFDALSDVPIDDQRFLVRFVFVFVIMLECLVLRLLLEFNMRYEQINWMKL